MKDHTARQGECISSIADENGLFWETIWNHPDNKELKERRKEPNILFPGDVVRIPDKRLKEESKLTNEVHKFRVKNSPARLKLRILKEGIARVGEPFVLTIDDVEKQRGTIPADGSISISIPPISKVGELRVGEGDKEEIYRLDLGHLDPMDTISGVKARLNSLGFDCGRADGELDEDTIEAITDFQAYINHPNPSGELDDQTRKALSKLHDQVDS